jgi:AcrR family transcriptional regulator
MARWEPNAQGRLLRAALELFAEHGYEETTTAQIAQRAGLTKTTLFRIFRDKREILFQGQDLLVAIVTESIEKADTTAEVTDIAVAALQALCDAHPQDGRAASRAISRIIASSAELRERAVYKRSAITTAMEDALVRRLGDSRSAAVLADLAVRAYYAGYENWIAADDAATFADHALREFTAHKDATRRLMSAAAG